jgi:hypothetical protein
MRARVRRGGWFIEGVTGVTRAACRVRESAPKCVNDHGARARNLSARYRAARQQFLARLGATAHADVIGTTWQDAAAPADVIASMRARNDPEHGPSSQPCPHATLIGCSSGLRKNGRICTSSSRMNGAL